MLCRHRLTILVCLAGLALSVGGCGKLRAERAAVAAQKKAAAAIDAYSKASEASNGAHRKVIEAFSAANGSRNLSEYRIAMREQVLPRMEDFVVRLAGTVVGSPELKRIHGILIAGYRRALTDIRRFVDDLQSPSELAKFGEIRARLQHEVRRYRAELDIYYADHRRKLRGGPAVQPGEPLSSPGAATGTGS